MAPTRSVDSLRELELEAISAACRERLQIMLVAGGSTCGELSPNVRAEAGSCPLDGGNLRRCLNQRSHRRVVRAASAMIVCSRSAPFPHRTGVFSASSWQNRQVVSTIARLPSAAPTVVGDPSATRTVYIAVVLLIMLGHCPGDIGRVALESNPRRARTLRSARGNGDALVAKAGSRQPSAGR